MNNDIIDFINRRWNNNKELFLTQNCYWFAKILCERFPNLIMAYLPTEGHFVTYDAENKCIYDVTGKVKPQGLAISLDWINKNEPEWYERLMRDCRD